MANKRSLYWTMQVGGWMSYLLLLAIWALLTNQFEWPIVTVWVLVFFTGIGVSHMMRGVILYYGWLSLKLYQAIWRLFLNALVFGLLGAVLHALISDFLLTEIKPLLEWPFSDLIQVMLAYAPQLLIWQLIYFSWNYLSNYEREEIKNLRLEASKNEIELNNLKSQLNPHFMFNAMNSIRALIDENPELAKQSVVQLSSILRNTLMVGKHQFISFEDELKVVQNYLELEGIRYEERLKVIYDIDQEVMNFQIPPLMLQTLAENAVKHGISRLMEGGTIKITAKAFDKVYFIEVRNSGKINDKAKPETGIGLANTRKRLDLLYKGKAFFDIITENHEVVARIELPQNAEYENTVN